MPVNNLRVSQLRVNMDCYIYSLKNADNRAILREHHGDLMDMLETYDIEKLYRYLTLKSDAMPRWYPRWVTMRINIENQNSATKKRFDETDKFILNILEDKPNIEPKKIFALVCEFLKSNYYYTHEEAIDRYVRKLRADIKKLSKKA